MKREKAVRLPLDQLSLPESFSQAHSGPVIFLRPPSRWQRWEDRRLSDLSCQQHGLSAPYQDPEKGRLASGKGCVSLEASTPSWAAPGPQLAGLLAPVCGSVSLETLASPGPAMWPASPPRREAEEAKESWEGEQGLSDPRPAPLVPVLAPALGGETAVEPGPCFHFLGQVTHNCKTEISRGNHRGRDRMDS